MRNNDRQNFINGFLTLDAAAHVLIVLSLCLISCAARGQVPDPEGMQRLTRLVDVRRVSACDTAALERHFGKWFGEQTVLGRKMSLTQDDQIRLRRLYEEGGLETIIWEYPPTRIGATKRCVIYFYFSRFAESGPVILEYSTIARKVKLCESSQSRPGTHGIHFESWTVCPLPDDKSIVEFRFASKNLDFITIASEE